MPRYEYTYDQERDCFIISSTDGELLRFRSPHQSSDREAVRELVDTLNRHQERIHSDHEEHRHKQ